MNTAPLFFSLAFFTAFIIYLFFGSYILSLNTKALMNRVFFVLCLMLGLWAFSFSIANSAPDYQTALFWRRVSAVGWGTMYSFLLHFILILTERRKALSRAWTYLLLYVPAMVNVLVFSIDRNLALGQYNLLNTAVGWVNVSSNNLWDWYFNVYYAGFVTLGVWLIWQWGRSAPDSGKQQQARPLAGSFVIALLLGTLTDIANSIDHSVPVPQLGPLVILIPISAIFYSIKRYRLMMPIIRSQTTESGRILSEANRLKIFQYATYAYIFGSFLYFVLHYFIYGAPLGQALLFGSALFLIGTCIYLVQLLNISEVSRDLFAALLVAFSIPLITLRFLESASTTVWAMPFILVILSVVFSKRRLIILLSVVTLLTQIWVWVKVPTATVQLNGMNHLIRIAIFSTALWMAFYVNSLYRARLQENEDQIGHQKMIAQVSADFVTVNESNLDEKIRAMLQLSGEYHRMDRSHLVILSGDQKTLVGSYEWCSDSTTPVFNLVGGISVDSFPWWMDQILNFGVVQISDVEMLPPEAAVEKALLKEQQIRSLISIPVTTQGKVLGLLGFSSVNQAKTWREDHLSLLEILANIAADAIVKVEAEKEINYLAYFDQLTGLPNYALYMDRLNQAIHQATRSEKLIVVIFLDLDSFKAVNDTMGHLGGDELLKRVAQRLSSRVRKYDTVSRFGGDEFLLMLPQIAQAKDIGQIVGNVMSAFAQPIDVNGQEFFITASAGIAVFPTDGEEAESLIKNADMAMYSSKDQGKNRYTLCSPVMKEDVLNRMRLTNNLYRALSRNELVLHYQPLVNAATKEVVGVEALIRWEHPDLGTILPGTFIPLAEQTGLINPIGEWVLRTACRQNKAWQDLGLPPVRVAVNLSVEQFRNSDLVSVVGKTLDETGLKPEFLELEITESTATKGADYFTRILTELKALGVAISIDDFGIEYSSLNRLKMLPIDRVKIAMQFVQGIAVDSKDEAIAKVIISLARNLGLKVIAEGVETDAQFEFLAEQMCDEIQGYYFYKPMLAAEIEVLLGRLNPALEAPHWVTDGTTGVGES